MIKQNIEKNGFHCFENFINKKELETLRVEIYKKLEENNFQYFFLTSEYLNNSLLNNINFSSKIKNLLIKILREYGFDSRNDEDLYKVLRVVTGRKSKKVSLDFHFDAHLLTLLIPIIIPNREDSDNGDLLIIKNLRKLHNKIFLNIAQKIFFQSRFFRYILSKKMFTKIFQKEKLKLVPGNIYIFNGFRTLHANLNINPADVRATCLVHFYDIFKDSNLIRLNRKLRQKKEINNFLKDKQN